MLIHRKFHVVVLLALSAAFVTAVALAEAPRTSQQPVAPPAPAPAATPQWGNCPSDCLDKGPGQQTKMGRLVVNEYQEDPAGLSVLGGPVGPAIVAQQMDSSVDVATMWYSLHAWLHPYYDAPNGEAWLGTNRGRGLEARGQVTGGYLWNDQGDHAYLAYQTPESPWPQPGPTQGFGVFASGKNSGGYFRSADNSGRAFAGAASGIGLQGIGNMFGVQGIGKAPDGRYGVDGISEVGIGVHGSGKTAGGYFQDSNANGFALVGFQNYKILGVGQVSFLQNHPYDNARVVVYAAPEGDEVATYTRGTARLSNGAVRVPLGETFAWVTNPDIGLTAHLTPRGNCKGLYVETLTTTELVVRELGEGTSNVAFDFLVHGLRIGFEETSVVQEKVQEARIPSMAATRELYQRHPELRRYSASERYQEMYRATGLPVPAESEGARALRQEIEEYDPSVHGPVGGAVAEVAAPPSKN